MNDFINKNTKHVCQIMLCIALILVLFAIVGGLVYILVVDAKDNTILTAVIAVISMILSNIITCLVTWSYKNGVSPTPAPKQLKGGN